MRRKQHWPALFISQRRVSHEPVFRRPRRPRAARRHVGFPGLSPLRSIGLHPGLRHADRLLPPDLLHHDMPKRGRLDPCCPVHSGDLPRCLRGLPTGLHPPGQHGSDLPSGAGDLLPDRLPVGSDLLCPFLRSPFAQCGLLHDWTPRTPGQTVPSPVLIPVSRIAVFWVGPG